MYPVSSAFLEAVKANTRKYYWTGRITTTAGTVYEFDQDDMVKGSGYITSQCCGSTKIELGLRKYGNMSEKLLNYQQRNASFNHMNSGSIPHGMRSVGFFKEKSLVLFFCAFNVF